MSVQPRYNHSSIDRDARDLLQTLIETPPSQPGGSFQPVALRSTIEQRRYALSGYLLRTWVDVVLHRAEWLLMIAVLTVFGFWFADGPARDWIYYQQHTPASEGMVTNADTDREPSPAKGVQPDSAQVPLPFTTID